MTTARRQSADPRILERYIRSRLLPRFIVRLREIEDGIAVHRMRLARRYADLRRHLGDEPGRFEERWREVAARWDFGEVNELSAQPTSTTRWSATCRSIRAPAST